VPLPDSFGWHSGFDSGKKRAPGWTGTLWEERSNNHEIDKTHYLHDAGGARTGAERPGANRPASLVERPIMEFVRVTTDQSSPKFVPPEERIATFDQDGTIWVSHPMYTQEMYCLDRVPVLAEEKPELRKVEPFKTVLSGNREAMAKLSMKDLEKILAATLTGMSVDELNAKVKKWLETAKDPAGLPVSLQALSR
jgi:hypothetical protein